ncbi:MAG: ABC transporter permease [Burkholderiaceae bacterium]
MTRRSAFQVQRTVVFALFLREMKTRFGTHKLGYLWVVLEPLLHVGVLLLIFSLLSARAVPNISFPVFLATGVAPWMLFINAVNRCMVAISSNRGLLGFSPVKPIDTVVTRVLVELVLFVSLTLVLMSIAWWLGYPVVIARPLELAVLILSLLVFGGSIGLVLAVVAHRYDDVTKFVPALLRPFYFISGIFFMLAALPPNIRELALWNPLAHWFDLIRVAVFSHYPPPTGSWLVVAACTSVTFLFALMLYRIRRFDLSAS